MTHKSLLEMYMCMRVVWVFHFLRVCFMLDISSHHSCLIFVTEIRAGNFGFQG